MATSYPSLLFVEAILEVGRRLGAVLFVSLCTNDPQVSITQYWLFTVRQGSHWNATTQLSHILIEMPTHQFYFEDAANSLYFLDRSTIQSNGNQKLSFLRLCWMMTGSGRSNYGIISSLTIQPDRADYGGDDGMTRRGDEARLRGITTTQHPETLGSGSHNRHNP